MKHRLSLALLVLAATTAALSQTSQPNSAPAAPVKKPTAAATNVHQADNDGQRAFDENCSRCHNAPSGFPPSISGTIVRHMRVRASLSKQDEEAIMRFLNP